MTQEPRKSISTYSGLVAGRSGEQTVKVVLSYLVKHPKYGKMLRRRTVAHVHDRDNVASVGDRVEIVKCRPMSKTKHWRLVRVLERN